MLKHTKSKTSQAITSDSRVDMTSLLDIVFIMLLFFIVTTSFSKTQTMDVAQPSNQCQANCEQGEQPILVSINEDSQVIFGNRIIDIEAVRANIEGQLINTPQASLIIRVNEMAQHAALIGALDQAKQAGIQKISVARW
ncbi:ExbD/TolR family protein [Kangiella koreensis]|uniref:Biopolymer transport protein ExbD/TolR n=1 Tax=Kangiella koreensis (strain DSM 16069 / JCM 12317 / KCTC 12182 / SW-125) TaxID=523791 RepID=C7R7V2_KANKD|nr:biopolymer transporter ExbD [Kangiella koreensis]ACV27635.1 Biopolymer transport protein ExbD/TolR [Kangiella koreensis DSM 16069]